MKIYSRSDVWTREHVNSKWMYILLLLNYTIITKLPLLNYVLSILNLCCMCTRGGGVIELKSRNFERGVTQTVTYIRSHGGGGYEGVKNGKTASCILWMPPPPSVTFVSFVSSYMVEPVTIHRSYTQCTHCIIKQLAFSFVSIKDVF